MRSRISILAVLAVVVMLGTMVACGGGGDGGSVELCFEEYDDWTRTDPASVPSSSDVMGTYNLTGYLVNYYEDGNLVLSIDDSDPYTYSGTMNIGVSSIYQSLTFEGENVVINATYSNDPSDTWSGVFHIDQGGMLFDVDYDIAGGELTTWSGLECFSASAAAMESLNVEVGTLGALIAPGRY